MKKTKIGYRLIAFLIFFTLITGWKNVFLSFQIADHQNTINGYALFLFIIGIIFLTLNMAAALGLFLMRKWGFWLTYFAISFSTFFFSTIYLPVFTNLFSGAAHPILLIIINLPICFYVIYLQKNYESESAA